jgi:hypothetical protein
MDMLRCLLSSESPATIENETKHLMDAFGIWREYAIFGCALLVFFLNQVILKTGNFEQDPNKNVFKVMQEAL